ncbi:type VI secretion system baseplate subunit TssG [Oceanimonas sp. CHS3-5]|uniref:type VI secretion system baseplate subunit TssG n=1 Tax=Oceanimonas sp. CHS3-5 TaxID=3068186 RepID=UPI00273E067A|nr:type VI secretion system baseplate subunit TssG [Oceanimonas sp. CHS3-5]MDP5291709.1 type VI secretion system baseplate subunit TssG [Oceanimonas sp. CHS3-5]
MDAKNGTTAHPVTGAPGPFTGSVRRYSLFKALELSCRWLMARNPDLNEEQAFNLIEFQANTSFGFAGADVESARFYQHQGRWRARLVLNPMGLVGAGSPLPAFYTEPLAQDDSSQDAARDFLQLFNSRLHRLLYSLYQKYRYPASFRQGARDTFSRRMFALIGLGNEMTGLDNRLQWQRLLSYLGLLSQRSHSAALIESVLRHYLKHQDIELEPCVTRQVPIAPHQQNRLGQANSHLGQDCVIGTEVRDRSSKFRIHIRHLDWQQFYDLLPIGSHYQVLNELVRFTLRDPLDYDIKLGLKPNEKRALALAENNECRLGWTTWLGSERADGTIIISGS